MKRVLTVAAVIAIAIPAFASSELTTHRITGVNQATYSQADGKLSPATGERGTTTEIWVMENNTNSYFGAMDWLATPDDGSLSIDWGDIVDGSVVGGYQFAYATDLSLPTLIDCTTIFFGDYAGFNANGYYAYAGFIVGNLPTAFGSYNGWLITVDLEPNSTFAILGNDLDGDGMTDFAYSYWFPSISGQDSATGPFLSNPDLIMNGGIYPTVAAAEAAQGIQDVWDAFVVDPNDPNGFVIDGSYWFGGWDPNDPNTIYAQFYMVLYAPGGGGCPNPGASGNFCTADIDGDCIVDLADLAALLANYNATGVGLAGDYDGDNDVDLADLATLLGQYNDNCQ
jgi:hypothetical protein